MKINLSQLLTLSARTGFFNAGTCYSMSMSESARLLSVAHGDGTIRLYDTRKPPSSARYRYLVPTDNEKMSDSAGSESYECRVPSL